MELFKRNRVEEVATPEDSISPHPTPRTNRGVLEQAGVRIHLFVDGFEGTRVIFTPEEKRIRVQRALEVLNRSSR